MVAPLVAISAGAGLLGGIAGLFGGNKKNAQAAEDRARQAALTNEQLALIEQIKQLTNAQNAQSTNVGDAYGGGTRYNPATGRWEASLGPVQQALQGASDEEELARGTYDQALRRFGLGQADALRQGAAGQADTALRQYNLFDQGVGAVDPASIASQLRIDRTKAVNAGYDDAMKAAGTMSLRTGTAAGDTFSNLARSRANSIAQTMGSPDIEAMSMAEGINNSRRGNLLNGYGLFSNQGSNFYDATFAPSSYAREAKDDAFKSLGLDLEKFNSTTGALGAATAGLGNAAAGGRAADAARMQGTDYNLWAKLFSGVGSMAGGLGK